MLAFVQIPSDLNLKGYEVTCYHAIGLFANLSTHKAKVGIRRIASEMGVAKNTALKYIDRLVEKGIIFKKTHYNPITKEYDVNEYTFLKVQPISDRVVQIPNKPCSEIATKRDSFNNNYCCLEDAKEKLLQQFDINVVSEAIKRYLQTTDKINNLLNWLIGVCNNIVKQNINKKAKAPQNSNTGLKRAYTKQDKPKHWNKFHFECDRTGQYTNEDLEQMLSDKSKKVPASIADASAILAKYQR